MWSGVKIVHGKFHYSHTLGLSEQMNKNVEEVSTVSIAENKLKDWSVALKNV